MTSELVVIFVDPDRYMRDEYLNAIDLNGFGDEGRKGAGIAYDFCGFLGDDSQARNLDVNLLLDTELPSDSRRYQALRAQAERKTNVFVFYHVSSPSRLKQQQVLEEIFGEKLKRPPLCEHHDHAPVFGAVKRVAHARGQSEDSYLESFNSLRMLFTGDMALESNLEALHAGLPGIFSNQTNSAENARDQLVSLRGDLLDQEQSEPPTALAAEI